MTLLSLPLIMALMFGQGALAQETSATTVVDLASPNTMDSSFARADQGDLREVLKIFLEISKIYRKSGSEDAIRDYISAIADRQGLKHSTDESGNLTVSVPASTNYQNLQFVLGLQAHMDMVFDYRLAKPGENTDSYFTSGVSMVLDGGKIHSKDYNTTLGADDGIGVALLIRLMLHPEIAHPELKIFFTTQEEAGMGGARNLVVPPTVKALINLDSEDFGSLSNGCLGSERIYATYSGLKISVPNKIDKEIFSVTLQGLKGGHSGLNINRGQGNAVKLLGEYISILRTEIPKAAIISMAAGDLNVFNKIPNSFLIKLEVSPKDSAKLQRITNAFLDSVQTRFAVAEETVVGSQSRIKLNVERLTDQNKLEASLDDNAVDQLTSMIKSVPNGVIVKHPGFTNDMDLSSNLAFLSVTQKDSSYQAQFGLMPRAFTTSLIEDFVTSTTKLLKGTTFQNEVSGKNFNPAWTPDKNSWLLNLFLDEFSGKGSESFKVESVAGGLEVAHFARKNPNLKILSLGPTLHDVHSYKESLEVKSVQDLIPILDSFVGKLPSFYEAMSK